MGMGNTSMAPENREGSRQKSILSENSFERNRPQPSTKPRESSSENSSDGKRLHRIGSWLEKVFITRKEYVLGDSCRCYWQKTPEIKRWYLIYRAVHFFLCFTVMFISFVRVAVYDEKTYKEVCESGMKRKLIYCFMESELGIHFNFTWPFYLTRWGIMGNFVQSAMGLAVVAKAYVKQSKITASDSKLVNKLRTKSQASTSSTQPVKDKYSWRSMISRSKEEHGVFTVTGSYWALHSVFVCLATLISFVYWALLHAVQPKGQPLAIINAVTEHAFNFITMSVDYALVAYPVTINQALWYTFLFVGYSSCNYLYYASGGIDQEFRFHYLYPFLDWRDKPGLAIAAIMGIGVVILIVHCLLLLIDHFKFKAKKKYRTTYRSRSTTPVTGKVGFEGNIV